jgi:hypothetical protein
MEEEERGTDDNGRGGVTSYIIYSFFFGRDFYPVVLLKSLSQFSVHGNRKPSAV